MYTSLSKNIIMTLSVAACRYPSFSVPCSFFASPSLSFFFLSSFLFLLVAGLPTKPKMADTNRASHTLDSFEAQLIAAYNNPSSSSGGDDPFVDHPLAVEGDQLLTTSTSVPSLRAQQPRADDTADPNSLFPLPHAIFPAHNLNPNLSTEDNIDTALLPPPPLLSERSSLTVLGSTDLDLGPAKESQLALPPPYAEPASEWTQGQLGQTKKKRSKRFWIGVGLGVAVVLILAVFLPVFFGVVRKSSASASSSSSSSSSGGGGGTTPSGTGGNGGSTSGVLVSTDKWGGR
ncbi:hypothetical protein K443DRAFT_227878 [Laccaria amethystina LaAM-08-1]|uniref:Uncharacterized protein n=1 Tax=Laccaria amethystina LaAM-08-1 TaxID=1095629 RepID=A0A0C9WYB1_9AGAR|nr:hypothetical protein K443DRAFT_227878 [Laccaria amethystina LaAM-08-1]